MAISRSDFINAPPGGFTTPKKKSSSRTINTYTVTTKEGDTIIRSISQDSSGVKTISSSSGDQVVDYGKGFRETSSVATNFTIVNPKEEIYSSQERPEVLQQVLQAQSKERPEVLQRMNSYQAPPFVYDVEKKPKGFARIKYEVDKKLDQQKQSLPNLRNQAQAEGASTIPLTLTAGAYLGTRFAKGVLGTGEFIVKSPITAYEFSPLSDITNVATKGFNTARTIRTAKTLGAIKGVGELGKNIVSDPIGASAEFAGGITLFKGVSLGISGARSTATAINNFRTVKGQTGGIIVKGEYPLETINRGVSIIGKPVSGGVYAGQGQGVTREVVFSPTYGREQLINDMIKGKGYAIQRANIYTTVYPPLSSQNALTTNRVLTKNFESVSIVNTANIPRSTVYKQGVFSNYRYYLKKEIGFVRYETFTPNPKALSGSTATSTSNIPFRNSKALASPMSNYETFKVTTNGQTTTYVLDKATKNVLGTITNEPSVFQITGVKLNPQAIVREIIKTPTTKGVSAITSLGASGISFLRQKLGGQSQQSIFQSAVYEDPIRKVGEPIFETPETRTVLRPLQSVYDTPTKTLTDVKTANKIITQQAIKPSKLEYFGVLKTDTMQGLKLSPIASLKGGYKLATDTIQDTATIQDQALLNDYALDYSTSQVYDTSLVQEQSSISRTTTINPIARSVSLKNSVFRETLKSPFSSKGLKKPSTQSKGVFVSQVRKGGTFQTVSVGGLGVVASKAVKIVTETPLATLRVIDRESGEIVNNNIFGNRFRPSKSWRGAFVEKNKFRIDTSGEVSGISRKSKSTSKNKKRGLVTWLNG